MTDHSPAGRTAITTALGAVVLSAVLLSGCGRAPSNGADSTTPPTGGTSATAAPTTEPTQTTPVRSVTANNLLTVDDVEAINDDPTARQVVEAADGQGRPVSQSYICLPENGLGSLGANSMVTRDFTFKIINAKNDPYPDSPLKNKPSVYTQALQFPDKTAATAGRASYASWIKGCAKTLSDQGYGVDGDQSLKLTTLHEEGGAAQAGMVAYSQPGSKDTENLYWESAAVTQVRDRLMVTITISWGMDTPGTFDDTEGDFINPQLPLVESSVERLRA